VTSGSFSPGAFLTAVTDNAGNPYVSASAGATWASTGFDHIEIWYAKDSLPGATLLTVMGPGGPNREVWFMEVAGMDLIAPLDVVATVSDAPATAFPIAPPVTPTTAASFVVSVGDFAGGVSGVQVGNPFHALAILDGNNTAYYVAGAPGTYGAVWDDGTVSSYCASTAAFKPAP
jgi:hypothetical protein